MKVSAQSINRKTLSIPHFPRMQVQISANMVRNTTSNSLPHEFLRMFLFSFNSILF